MSICYDDCCMKVDQLKKDLRKSQLLAEQRLEAYKSYVVANRLDEAKLIELGRVLFGEPPGSCTFRTMQQLVDQAETITNRIAYDKTRNTSTTKS